MQRKFDKKLFKSSVINNVKNLFRKTIDEATPMQMFQAVSYAVKDIIIDEWIATHKEYEKQDAKTVYYLSMEFLMGRASATTSSTSGRARRSRRPSTRWASI